MVPVLEDLISHFDRSLQVIERQTRRQRDIQVVKMLKHRLLGPSADSAQPLLLPPQKDRNEALLEVCFFCSRSLVLSLSLQLVSIALVLLPRRLFCLFFLSLRRFFFSLVSLALSRSPVIRDCCTPDNQR